MNAVAFGKAMLPGARINAIYSSDIGHFDVVDMRDPLPEAFELVEGGLITEDEFRNFVFANAVWLWGTQTPCFFEGTAVARDAAAVLKRGAPTRATRHRNRYLRSHPAGRAESRAGGSPPSQPGAMLDERLSPAEGHPGLPERNAVLAVRDGRKARFVGGGRPESARRSYGCAGSPAGAPARGLSCWLPGAR